MKKPLTYPAWIPNPEATEKEPIVLVHTEDEHKYVHPEDHAERQAYAPPDSGATAQAIEEAVSKAVSKETRRCYEIAIGWRRGGAIARDIAKAILNDDQADIERVLATFPRPEPAAAAAVQAAELSSRKLNRVLATFASLIEPEAPAPSIEPDPPVAPSSEPESSAPPIEPEPPVTE